MFPRFVRAGSVGALMYAMLFSGEAANGQPVVTWNLVPATATLPLRALMATAYDPVGHRVVVFGGVDSGGYLGDTWAFDGLAWSQLNTPIAPTPRVAAGMTFDAPTNSIVLFGGFDGGTFSNETWVFDCVTSTWTKKAPAVAPKGVSGPMVFSDPITGQACTYGGYDGHFYQFKTSRWNGSTWTQLATGSNPGARSAAIIAQDLFHHNVVMFGGLGSLNPANTWVFDGTTWQEQFPSNQPPLRSDAGAAFDPSLNGVVLFGGTDGAGPLNDTWFWDGFDWTQLQEWQAPLPREAFGMVLDDAIHRVLVVAGDDGQSELDETWAFSGLGSFKSIGPGIGGSHGVPTLTGSGDLSPASTSGFIVTVGKGPPSTPGLLFVGATPGAVPLLGGTLYPFPIAITVPVATDGLGNFAWSTAMPWGVPAAAHLVLQVWMPDATGPQGAVATNGFTIDVP